MLIKITVCFLMLIKITVCFLMLINLMFFNACVFFNAN